MEIEILAEEEDVDFFGRVFFGGDVSVLGDCNVMLFLKCIFDKNLKIQEGEQ